eukprot:2463577-Rhodomonas_salina.2
MIRCQCTSNPDTLGYPGTGNLWTCTTARTLRRGQPARSRGQTGGTLSPNLNGCGLLNFQGSAHSVTTFELVNSKHGRPSSSFH